MIAIPAIDLRGGKVVRLKYGDPDQQTVYGDAPADTARSFEQAGAKMIHVVDLDGAFTGSPTAREIIADIASAVDIPVEVGGGVRSMDVIEGHLGLGVRRVVIGTAGIRDPEFLKSAVERFGDAIVGGLDARDGKVAVKGWVETSSDDVATVGRRMVDAGVLTVVHTDIGRDGVLTGPNIEASLALARATGLAVIVSGGVSSIDDVRAVRRAAAPDRPGGPAPIEGCIIGRAIYTGAVDLAEAVRETEQC